jgi:pilus assembly protein CpaB
MRFLYQLNLKNSNMNLEKFKNLRTVRPGKTWIILGVALAIGGIAAFAANSFLSKQVEAIEARGKSQMVSVVVAKTDIARGVKLDNGNVAVRSVPREYGHSVAVTPDDFARIDGQPLAYPVKAGEMILWGLMETQRAPTFSARVEAGRRAMTVPVDEINSISGMLEPGDMIDLIVTVSQGEKKLTFPLLQKVHVMATGQRSVDDPAGGPQKSYSTVTIDTTPLQAQNLIVARDVGKLTALLRNPQDEEAIGADANDLASLMGIKGKLKTGSGRGGPPPSRTVPVIYGNGKVPPEAIHLRRMAGTKVATPAAEPQEPAEAPAPSLGMR